MELRVKNFLTAEECNKVIDFYTYNLDKKFTHERTEPIKILNCKDPFINYCLEKIKLKCCRLDSVYMDNAEIINWLDGSFAPPHYDKGDRFAAIIYLNDNYVGGELILNNVKIKLDVGEFIVFDNGNLLHSVNTVTGRRCTLSTWFKLKEKE
jgi:hypothetical protein